MRDFSRHCSSSRSRAAAAEAETEPDNTVSRKVLEKCGFVASGAVGEEGPRFILTRERRDML